MAEKEERICICKLEGNETESVCGGSITRQEAIERINHAICVEVHGPCDICEQVRCGNEGHCNDYKKYAEAALNALLSDGEKVK